MNKPTARDQQSVKNYLENGSLVDGKMERPLLQADTEFVFHKEDLVTLRPGRESAWLDAFVERILKIFHCDVIQVCLRQPIGLGMLTEVFCLSEVHVLQQGTDCIS